jgi:arylsulfatase A-like enzyme
MHRRVSSCLFEGWPWLFDKCICSLASFLICAWAPVANAREATKPNFIVLLTDDQGYNDLGCFGSQTNKTPRLDQMAREGLKLTSFYSQPVCGPARGALMTGRYPVRIGGGWRVNPEETMIPEVLKPAGYATACIGKWDMSQRMNLAGMVPNDKGFDYYFGTLGATDLGEVELFRNRSSLGTTKDIASLTYRYTEEAMQFIKEKKASPFLLYLAFSAPHVMIDASAQFKGKSAGDLYGDVIEELDWNVGRILDLLAELKLAGNTYVIFTSDNGAWIGWEAYYKWLHYEHIATGSSKPLRNGKGSAWEGGFRLPAIVWAPGHIPAGRVSGEIVSTLDILPTFAEIAGCRIPANRPIDGVDQSALFTGKSNWSARDTFFYHIEGELQAVRHGRWKLALPGRTKSFPYAAEPDWIMPVTALQLFDLEADLSERHDVASEHPDVVQELLELSKTVPSVSSTASGANVPRRTPDSD